MEFSENLKSKTKLYFKERYDVDLLDSQVIEDLDNLDGLYLAFTDMPIDKAETSL